MPSATGLIFLRAGTAILAATLGGLLAIRGRDVSHRTLCALVSFAAGALLSVTILNIAPEAAKLADWRAAIVSIAIGALVFYLIGRYVSYVCPACAASAIDERSGYLRLGTLLVIALGLHSTMDGLAIAVGAEEGIKAVGVLILLAVSYHKLPEGIALASVARLAGFSRPRALLITVLIELTTGLGAFIGLVAVSGVSSFWLGVIMAHAGGSFIYIVGFAVITELREHEPAPIILNLAAGFLVMAALSLILPRFGPFAHGH